MINSILPSVSRYFFSVLYVSYLFRTTSGTVNQGFFFGKRSTFQFPATDVMLGIVDLHAYIISFLFFVFIFVFWLFANILFEFFYKAYYPSSAQDLRYILTGLNHRVPTHNLVVEFIWTIFPSLVLVAIAVPSFSLLYLISDLTIIQNYVVFVQCVGKQWYWEYCTYIGQVVISDNIVPVPQYVIPPQDSYMIPTGDLPKGKPRLLSVDRPLVLPVQTDVLLGVTSTDVIHSWAVPSFGVKMDAIPGHLNRVKVNIKRTGVYYGQCSELCGVNHGFMPIEVRVVDPETFFSIQKLFLLMSFQFFTSIAFCTFFFGMIFVFLFYDNLIRIFISVELIFLSVSLLFIGYDVQNNALLSHLFSFFVLIFAGIETAIALSIVLIYFRITSKITFF